MIKNSSHAFIILLSEAIWIYYAIILFTSVEWGERISFELTWWIVAGIVGYIVNIALKKRLHLPLLLIINGCLLSLIVIQNWLVAVPSSSWGVGLALSIAVSVIYFRSTSLAYREPRRQEMVRRFEGNIIFYIVFALIFTINDWGNEWFHFLFIVAIFFSLLGMALTLSNQEDGDEEEVAIQKVGHSNWFIWVIVTFTVLITTVSVFILFSPARNILYFFSINIWELLTTLTGLVHRFLEWFFQFFNERDMEAPPLEMAPMQTFEMGEEMQEPLVTLPIFWIIVGITVLFAIFAIWGLSKLMMKTNWKKVVKAEQVVISKEPWWPRFQKRWQAFLRFFLFMIGKHFPSFYRHLIFWYYYRVKRWGKKINVRQLPFETSQEYIDRLATYIPESKNVFYLDNERVEIKGLLRQLNEQYQQAYYSEQMPLISANYAALMKQLRKLRVKRTFFTRKNKTLSS